MTHDERERLRSTVRIHYDELWRSLSRWLLRLGLLAGFVYLLLRSHSIITTLIGAGILACAAGALTLPLSRLPGIRGMKAHGRRSLCAAVAIAALLGILIGIIFAFLKPFQDQTNELRNNWPRYQPQIVEKFDQLKEEYKKLPAWAQNLVPEQVRNLLDEKADTPNPPTADNHAPAMSVPPGVTDAVTGAFKNIGKGINSVVELILLPVLAFYFLVDGRALRNEFIRFLPHRRQQRASLAILKESGEIMRAYLLAQLILALIAGIAIWTLLSVFNIKYALILALIAAVTRVIPVIGPLLCFIPLATLVSAQTMQTGNYGVLAIILIFFTVMHLVESKVITPMILGHRLHLHPVVVIVVLLIGGEFFGLLGMFLAAPVTALLRAIFLHAYVYPRRHRAHGTARLRRALAHIPRKE